MTAARTRIVFLFGAGASFGAGGILPEPPPLGAQLLPALASLFRSSWGQLPSDIAAAMADDFESGMAQIYERFSPAIPSLMREMALYFSEFRPYQGTSLYCKLVRDVAECLDVVAFSTLNYECVLEYSLASAGRPIDYFGQHQLGTSPVWKLHGSCNMFAEQIQAQGIEYGSGIIFEAGVRASLDRNEIVRQCVGGNALAPVMSLYMAGKPLAISPSAISSIQKLWADAVRAATAVICVGVRPHEPDSHIWTPLAETAASLFFVGDEAGFERWTTKSGRAGTTLGHRFSDAYGSIVQTVKAHATE